jgi:ABC-type transport system involved in cytochrome c biogenesis permease subunit
VLAVVLAKGTLNALAVAEVVTVAAVEIAAVPVVFWFHVGTVPVSPLYATLVAVAALPVTLIPQVPEALPPVRVGL